MVFISGPRQVGKTTLGLEFLPKGERTLENPAYMNWDNLGDQEKILKQNFPTQSPLLIFAEIHKYKNWRNYLKGIYDKKRDKYQIIVTGSAHLSHYARGGDALTGRTYTYRLHPFAPDETEPIYDFELTQRLIELGGFPEPFLSNDKRLWRRWQRERIKRVTQEDLIQLEKVQEVSQLTLLSQLLPSQVGSNLSINNLSQELKASFKSVEKWVQIFENLYYCFRIAPYIPSSIVKSLKKEKNYIFGIGLWWKTLGRDLKI